ncbi:hypothetical protein H671_2g5258 [Cricetulus griseus]|nr:hypothetical protein H671_2g5258 [Cricetulus griseus]
MRTSGHHVISTMIVYILKLCAKISPSSSLLLLSSIFQRNEKTNMSAMSQVFFKVTFTLNSFISRADFQIAPKRKRAGGWSSTTKQLPLPDC